MRPSLRDRLPEGEPHPFDDILRMWDIDLDSYPDFETKAIQGWMDLKAAKRKHWKDKGYLHYEHMNDEELTDSPHTVIFSECDDFFPARQPDLFSHRARPQRSHQMHLRPVVHGVPR